MATKEIAIDNKALLDAINKINDQLLTLAAQSKNDTQRVSESLDRIQGLLATSSQKAPRARVVKVKSDPAVKPVAATKKMFFVNEYETTEATRAKWAHIMDEIHKTDAYIKAPEPRKLHVEAEQVYKWFENHKSVSAAYLEELDKRFKEAREAAKTALGHNKDASSSSAAAAATTSAVAPSAAATPAAPAAKGKKPRAATTTPATPAAPAAALAVKKIGRKKAPNATLSDIAIKDEDESDVDDVDDDDAESN